MWTPKKNKDLTVQFITTVPGLELIEECRPRPAKEFIPEWWKSYPPFEKDEMNSIYPKVRTVKTCPSFPDYFSRGYVVPAWADMTIQYNEELEMWNWRVGQEVGGNVFNGITPHSNPQFVSGAKPKSMGIDGTFVFKLLCPWKVITAKNVSILQLPMFYSFNPDWTALPGIIDTHINSEINQQLLYHANGKEVFIPRGTPIAQYIPIPTKYLYELEVRKETQEDKTLFDYQFMAITSKFFGGYRKLKKLED